MAICIAACLTLHSCSRPSDSPTEIVFWAFGAEGEHVQSLIPGFEARNPDIHVRLQMIPWTAAHEKVLTAYAGDSTPDLCQWGNTWIPEMHLLEAIEPLDSRVSVSKVIHRGGYFPGIWETNRIDSVLYGIPWYVDTRVLFYRKDLLARAGYRQPPKTWDEWEKASQAIVASRTGEEKYAVLLPTTEWAPPVILGLQCGAQLLSDRGTRGDFSGKRFTRAFNFYISFFREHLAPVGVTQVTNIYQGMTDGFFSMYISGPWNIGEFRRRMPDSLQDEWMTAPLPSPDSIYPGASLAGGSSLVLFRASRHKEAAWRLIEYLSEPEQQLHFYRETGDLPASVEAWEDSSLSGNKYIRAFRIQLERVASPPKVPEWEQIAVKVQDYADLASRGMVSVHDALASLDRDVNVILEKRRWMLNERKD
ncbi:MAG: sugar ABC transporter substrate-binding protein [Bacteroidota bacterium]